MKCPYCGRNTNDIPTHLSKNELCHDKHCDKLKDNFSKLTIPQEPQYKTCPTCNGSKSVKRFAFDSFGSMCPTCNGVGKLSAVW